MVGGELGGIAGHAAVIQGDVAVAGNDPHIAEVRRGPTSQRRVQSELSSPPARERRPPRRWDGVTLDLRSAQDPEALSLHRRHLDDHRKRLSI
jgi:hypothetical protein